MKLITVVNNSYISFVRVLCEIFDDCPELTEELKIAELQAGSDKLGNGIMDRISVNINDYIDALNAKDVTCIEKSPLMIGLRAKHYYSRLSPDETDVFWTKCQEISKHAVLVSSMGDSVGQFEGVAEKYIAKIKAQKLTAAEIPGAIASGMMNDPDLQKSILEIMNPETLNKLIANMGPVIKSSLAGHIKPDNTETDETVGEEEEEEDDCDHVGVMTSAEQTNQSNKKKKKKKKKKRPQGITASSINKLTDHISDMKLTEEDLKDVSDQMQDMLSGADGMGTMMAQLAPLMQSGKFDLMGLMQTIMGGGSGTNAIRPLGGRDVPGAQKDEA